MLHTEVKIKFLVLKKKGTNEFNYGILFKFTDVGVHYFKAH